MISLVTSLAPLVLAGLLAVTGASKLFGRRIATLAANTVLLRVLGTAGRAALVLRTTGAVELVIAAALLAAPGAVASGAAATVLGVGFTAYLGYAKATAPESSCGCSAKSEGPIGWRAFLRAALVVAGGLAALAAATPWWSQAGGHPVASVAFVVVAAAVLLVLSDGVDRLWLLPLRRMRLRVFGHPLAGFGAEAPVAASVELLERSLAWQATLPLVRSALVDHWIEDGWRILRYTGVYEGEQQADGTGGDEVARPVSVLFALDLSATVDNTSRPAVRVTVIDDRTDEVLPVTLDTGAHRALLPLAEPALAAQPSAT